MTVQIDSDILRDLCLDRVDEFSPAREFPTSFWNDIFDYLDEIGWLPAALNSPSYIVDNIAVNGEFYTLEDCYSNGILEEGEEPDSDWQKFGNYYCTGNMGI